MRKLEKRAIMCLMLAAVLFIGLAVFAWRYVVHGAEWAGFYGNTQIYKDGMVNRGAVFDRNGTLLINCSEDGIYYPDDYSTRISTLHVVGDPAGNIPDGAINKFRSQLIGYDIVNGTYDTSNEGKNIKLTIDAASNATAYNYLQYYDAGTVAVMNYKTGEIMTEVSTPAFDPLSGAPDDPEDSVYFNIFYQGQVIPGSTFKLVTSAAAIDTLPDIDSFSFDCDGKNEFSGEDLTCIGYHGTENFEDALATSCNGAFGEISREVGAKTLTKYVKKLGLTSPVDISGIETSAGSFNFPSDDDLMLSWSGIGQGEDLINPASMLVYVAAIANGGEAVQPYIFKESNFIERFTGGKSLGRYLSEDTASKLRTMMKNNVVKSYGESNFYGLDIYAKSGTAENGDTQNSLFTGFIDDEDHPYAFFCWVRGGEGGSTTAGPIVRETLNTLINDN